MIPEGGRGDLHVDVDGPAPQQGVQAAGDPPRRGVRRRGEVDETGPAVHREGHADPFVPGRQHHRLTGDDGDLGEGRAVTAEQSLLLRRQHTVQRRPVVAASAQELTEHREGVDVEHRRRARQPPAEQLLALLAAP